MTGVSSIYAATHVFVDYGGAVSVGAVVQMSDNKTLLFICESITSILSTACCTSGSSWVQAYLGQARRAR